MKHRILVVNGPNLNLLGEREPEVYGSATLDEIMTDLAQVAGGRNAELTSVQSNIEGELVNHLHEARTWASGIILNPGAYTHYSIAIRDAIAAISVPVIETHLSNVHAREPFRDHSVVSAVCLGVVAGFGRDSYVVALEAMLRHLDPNELDPNELDPNGLDAN